MIDEIDLIRKIDFFQALDDRVVKHVAEVCIPKNYSKSDYLIRQGETGLGLFLVVSGRLKVEVEKDGHKTVVAELKAEDFVGELAVIDNKPRSANVICVEDTRCLVLTRDSFLKLLDKYPQIAVQMAKSLSARLRNMDEFVSGKPLHVQAAPSGETGLRSATDQPGAEAVAQPAAEQGEAGGQRPSSKDRIRDFMVDTFNNFYTVKAMTRFSVAVVGCPVDVRVSGPREGLLEECVGEVKVIVFPGSQERVVSLEAYEQGSFSVTLLQPTRAEEGRACIRHSFKGRLAKGDQVELHVPVSGVDPRLERQPTGWVFR